MTSDTEQQETAKCILLDCAQRVSWLGGGRAFRQAQSRKSLDCKAPDRKAPVWKAPVQEAPGWDPHTEILATR